MASPEMTEALMDADTKLAELSDLRSDILAARRLQAAGYHEAKDLEEQAVTRAYEAAQDLGRHLAAVADLFKSGEV